MTSDQNQIMTELLSADVGRIGAALRSLCDRMARADEIELPWFDDAIFAGCAEPVPEGVQLDFIVIMRRYRRFSPPPTDAARRAAQARVVLRFAEGYIAYEVALGAKIARDTERAVHDLMDALVAGLDVFPNGPRGAALLVSRLLYGRAEVRAATLRHLTQWPRTPAREHVVAHVLPQLDAEEARLLQ